MSVKESVEDSERTRPGMSSATAPGLDSSEQQTPMIEALCRLWAAWLGVDVVQPDDDFLVLGGDADSLAALIEEIEAEWGLSVPPALAERPTVAELLRLWQVDGATEESAAEIDGVEANAEIVHDRVVDFGDWVRATDASAVMSDSTQQTASRWEKLREKIAWRALYTGPTARGRALIPYHVGLRLQQCMIQLPFVQSYFAASLYALRMWQQALNDPTPWPALATRHLLAATWYRWRGFALRDPRAFEQWVTVRGAEVLSAIQRAQRGVVVVFPHSSLYPVAAHTLALRGREQYTIRWVQAVDAPLHDIYHPRSQAARARQMRTALDLLARNGVVWIAGDGQMGTRGPRAVLGDSYIHIRTGAAELAVEADALIVALSCDIAENGKIELTFTELGNTELGNGEDSQSRGPREARVDRLTADYARLFETRWLQQYPTIQPLVLPVFLGQKLRNLPGADTV